MAQATLFGSPIPLPVGFKYREDFITPAEEQALIDHVATLSLEPYKYRPQGTAEEYVAKRRVTNFGLPGQDGSTPPFPEWLIPLLEKAAKFAGNKTEDIIQAHLIEYSPGAPIGWHRDMPPYEKIIGISLGSACRFQLRRQRADRKWDRFEIEAQPRSIYVMAGPARSEWEHGIPPVKELRYSITFRTAPGTS